MPSLETLETQVGQNPKYSVIWLHGLGADGNDFVPIIPELRLPEPKDSGIRFVFPHAPTRPITLNGGMVMRGWYDIVSLDFSNRADEAGVRESAELIAELITAEVNRGIATENIFLAGFSQGGAIALFAGLRYPTKLAGILALSTYLPVADKLATEKSTANSAIDIYYAHGNDDDVIAIQYAEQSRDFLLEQGYTIEWHEYPMAHSVHPGEIQTLSAWLHKRTSSV